MPFELTPLIAGWSGVLLSVGMLPAAEVGVDARAQRWSDSAATITSDARVSNPALGGVWTDHVVVQLREGVAPSSLNSDAGFAALAATWQVTDVSPAIEVPPTRAELARKLGLDRFLVVTVPVGTDTQRMSEQLAGLHDLFERAETDPIILPHSGPSDPLFGSQWAFSNDSDSDIDWLESWQIPFVPTTVVVAVLDTGVSTSHPDLRGQLVTGRCFVCGTDPTRTDDTTSPGGAGSHGTKCSGIVAAMTDNGIGVAGTSRNAKVMPIKIFSGLIASTTAASNGLIWATDNGAHIASMSWGFARNVSGIALLRTAVEYADAAGVLMIASTGNTPSTPGNPVQIGYPAAWPEVIAVGATKPDDAIWEGTTLGPELDVVAPGQNIYTTIDQSNNLDGYGPESGTSMSAPMVAGVAALVWGANPNLSSAEVRAIVENSTDDLGDIGTDAIFGRGRINGFRALTDAIATTRPCTADFDHDGQVGVGDLFAFLAAYFAAFGQTGSGLAVDFDRNGAVDVEDLFSFMAVWFAGCP